MSKFEWAIAIIWSNKYINNDEIASDENMSHHDCYLFIDAKEDCNFDVIRISYVAKIPWYHTQRTLRSKAVACLPSNLSCIWHIDQIFTSYTTRDVKMRCVPGVTRHAVYTLQWSHNEHDGVSPSSWLFIQPFIQAQVKEKKLKLRVTGLCEGNSPVTGEFPAQRASNAENISIWWRHDLLICHWK